LRIDDDVRIATFERPDQTPRDAGATVHVQFRSWRPRDGGNAKGGGP